MTLNGQTAAAPEPEGRQVKLDDIPSSLIGRVDVVKAITPDRDANAIAGQVDINTLTAFDRPRDFLYARAAYGLYDLNGRSPYEGDATVGARLGADRQFGIVLSGNYSYRPIESENLQGSTNWRTLGTQVVPDDFRLRDYNLVRQRYGAVANLDWRPGEGTRLFLRTLYSVFKDNETRDQFRVEIPGLRATPPTATSVGVFGQTGADLGSFTGGRGTRFVRRRIEDDTTVTVQTGGEFKLSGATLAVEGTYSKALKKDPLRSEFQFRTGNNPTAGLSGTYDLTDLLFRVDPNGTPGRAYDASFYPARQVNYDRRRAAETLYQGRADVTLPVPTLGEGTEIKLGAKYLGRRKVNERDFQQFDLNGFTLATAGGVEEFNYIYGNRYRFGPRVDYDAVQAYVTANPARAVFNAAASLANALVNDYDVREDIYAGYGMGTFRIDKLTIIPGARVEHTDGMYQGKLITPTSTPTQGFDASSRQRYIDVFPDLLVRYDASPELTLRAAGTTAIGRPNYATLAPFVLVDQGANSVSLGTPGLKPLRSQNADVSVEYYLRNKGLISIAAFYKHIDSPIFSQGLIQSGNFAGVALTNALVTQSINARSAKIYGVEVNAQVPFTFLPQPFDGLGVNLNYTRTGGGATGAPGRTDKVPNFLQSRTVASAQVYYEKGRVGLRAAFSYRSRYLDTVGASPALDQYTENHGQLDVRGQFALAPQATVFLEGSNLTDASWRRFIGTPDQLVENERYGYSVRGGLQLAF